MSVADRPDLDDEAVRAAIGRGCWCEIDGLRLDVQVLRMAGKTCAGLTISRNRAFVWGRTEPIGRPGWIAAVVRAINAGEPEAMIFDFCRDRGFEG